MKYNVISSGYQTSTVQISPGTTGTGVNNGPGGMLHSVQLLPDGTNASSVVIYNGTSNTAGQEVAVLSIAANTTAPQQIVFNNPVVCQKGIRAVLAGTGGTVVVGYSVGA